MTSKVKSEIKKIRKSILSEGDTIHYIVKASIDINGAWITAEFGHVHFLKRDEDPIESEKQLVGYVEAKLEQRIKHLMKKFDE